MTTRSVLGGRMRLAVIATVGALAASLSPPAFAGAASAAAGLGPPNTWVATGQMGVARSGQTATLLRNGRVLVAGGGTATAALYDPANRTFSPTGHLPVAVTNASATLLGNGKVLVAGGRQGGHQVANAELYDPATGTWSATGAMTVARSGQTATLLANGQVLVAGGGCNGHGTGCDAASFLNTLSSAELYNPATGTWTATGAMAFGRQFATATALPSGNVLVAGGFSNCDNDFCSDTKTAELYHPTTGKWTRTGPMSAAREQHTATLLSDGEVLVAGGRNEGGTCCGPFRYATAELYDPATGTWHSTAPMATDHAGATATLLPNGWVLVAGGGTPVAELYEPGPGIWASPGAMSTARTGAAAVLLRGGQVLVTGGDGPDGQPQSTAEEFLAGPGPLVTATPASIAFAGQLVGTVSHARSYQVANVGSASLVVTGTAVTGKNPGDYRVRTNCTLSPVPPGGTCTVSVRFAPSATQLRTATVAVSDNAPGGSQGAAVSGYGAGPNAFAPVGSMSAPREHAAAVLLPDGKVLIAGGQTATGQSLASAELYDPATKTFSATGPLNAARSYPAATLLPDGKVLITGGLDSNFTALSSAELYSPATGTWATTTPMNAAGYAQTSTLLRGGKVLVTGFTGGGNTAEVYDPANAAWTSTGPMTAAQFFGTATLLQDGRVLLAGGGTSAAEVYNQGSNAWKATGSLNQGRQDATATLLTSGEVLVAGGEPPGGGTALNSAELFDPETGRWSVTGTMVTGRAGATATALPDGTVLVTGGCGGECGGQRALSGAELFDGSFWIPAAPMTQPRVYQTATLLPDGTVLVAGGGQTADSAGSATAEAYTTAQVSVRPSSGAAGSAVTVSGSGYYAGEPVLLTMDGATVLGHAKTGAAGTFSSTVTIPAGTAKGGQTITAQGRRSFASASTLFTVTG